MTKDITMTDVIEMLKLFNKRVKQVKQYKCYRRKDIQEVIKSCRPLNPKTQLDILKTLDKITDAILYLELIIENRSEIKSKYTVKDINGLSKSIKFKIKELDIIKENRKPLVQCYIQDFYTWNGLSTINQYVPEAVDMLNEINIALKEALLGADYKI